MTVQIKTEQELADFISDLRAAARQSRRTGGCYHATAVTDNGKSKVTVGVWLPVQISIRKRIAANNP